jgi:hypothetical protein
MKRYAKIYLNVFFYMSILFLLLSIIVNRRSDILLPFPRISYGIFVVSLFLSFTIWLFKLEKGNSLMNVILGYFILIPAILIIRNVYGTYLFRFSSLIYIVFIVIGIIYGLVLWIVSKKYKKEVDDLNKLINKEK